MKTNHPNIEILKYLFTNDTGDFLDVRKAFKSKNVPTWKNLQRMYNDLKDYIEVESVYNYRGIISIGDPNTSIEVAYLKARINQKGREYYSDYLSKRISLTISKRGIYLTVCGLILAIITLYFTIINPEIFKRKTVINDETFPNPTLCIGNSSSDTVILFIRQKLIVWLPEDVYGNAATITGFYEIVSNKIKNESLELLPNETIKVMAKLLNKPKLYQYFLSEENELSLIIRPKNGRLVFSENIPFSKNWIEKYFLTVNIGNNNTP